MAKLRKVIPLSTGQTCVAFTKGWQWRTERETSFLLRRRQRKVALQSAGDLERAFFEMASLNLELANEGLESDNEALHLLEKVLSEV